MLLTTFYAALKSCGAIAVIAKPIITVVKGCLLPPIFQKSDFRFAALTPEGPVMGLGRAALLILYGGSCVSLVCLFRVTCDESQELVIPKIVLG